MCGRGVHEWRLESPLSEALKDVTDVKAINICEDELYTRSRIYQEQRSVL